MKKSLRFASAALAVALAASCAAPAFAAGGSSFTKSETVYAVMNADGSIQSTTVSEHVYSASGLSKVTDQSTLTNIQNTESSAELRKQVLAARAIQAKRYAAPGFKGVHCNAQLNAGQVRRICRMTPGAEQLLRSSYDALGLSARAHDRILRVARTVADLAGKTLLDEDSLLEALQYRAQEKLDG